MASTGSRDGLSESFQELLSNVAKGLFTLGGLITLVSVGLLIFTCFRVASGDATVTAEAIKNVEILQRVLTFGAIGVAVGSSYLFWGDERGSIALLLGAAVLFFAPAWVPMIVSERTNDASTTALVAIQKGGGMIGVVAAIVLVLDVVGKSRQRIKVGVKADQMKYGKGVKEEKDRQNVFLGKCWQLPYCRKFVRERCPIYHSRRTCWKERVGCMCEEEVIRVAMENKPIPKDAVLNTPIPKNHRLNEKQKAERCRNCVIYNEHQRHKYKAVVPAVLAAFGLFYLGLHAPLIVATEAFIHALDQGFHHLTIQQGQADVPTLVVESLLFFTMVLLLSYSMKLVEYLVFKLKI